MMTAMSAVSEDSLSNIETRLTALESAVSRLSSIVESPFALDTLAAPVAIPLATKAAQHDFGGKFLALLDIGEGLLKYSAAMAFSTILAEGGPQADDVMTLYKVPPTLGKLADGLRKIIDDLSKNAWPLSIMREVFRKPNGKPTPTARYLFEEFLRLRNDERGHGALQSEGHYEGLYLKNHLIIEDCVKASSYLKIPLIQIHAIDNVEEQSAYTATLLMGIARTTLGEPIVTPTRVAKGAICLWDKGTQLLSLGEFVAYRLCTVCQLEHLFLAERITGDKIYLHSSEGNHRMNVQRAPA